MAKPKKSQVIKSEGSYFEKIELEVRSNQSTLSLVLGGLIVLVVGVLVFNYFNKPQPQLGPAQQTEATTDTSPESLPGKYTVKEGDTLFLIADKYYQDGYKYTEIAKANNLTNADNIEKDQVLEIPRLGVETNAVPVGEKETALGTGGGNTTIWGPKIEGDTYTVTEGDWLSTIAARAYGDIYSFDKIAKANDISNPNLIEPGTILKLPR